MKYLALALLLCALPSLSTASCMGFSIKPGMTQCQDPVDKTWHPVGSKWRNSDCMDCVCGTCCTAYETPTRFPDDCVKVFDKEACVYRVHKKDDPSVECPVSGGVGK